MRPSGAGVRSRLPAWCLWMDAAAVTGSATGRAHTCHHSAQPACLLSASSQNPLLPVNFDQRCAKQRTNAIQMLYKRVVQPLSQRTAPTHNRCTCMVEHYVHPSCVGPSIFHHNNLLC